MLDTLPCMILTRACVIVSQGMYQAAPQQAQGMYQAAPQQMYATQEVLVREPHVYHSTSSLPFLAQPLMVFCDRAVLHISPYFPSSAARAQPPRTVIRLTLTSPLRTPHRSRQLLCSFAVLLHVVLS